jgi:hypothetical protein
MPIIGTLKIAGMTEGEATAAIVKAYDEQNVGRHPMVVVLRTMAAGR